MSIQENVLQIQQSLPKNVTLVAVSKTYGIDAIKQAYNCHQKDFGENKVQELINKYAQLPKDIRWHLIGHLQTNKVKNIIAFVHLIHSVDSPKLLQKINDEATKIQRKVSILLQLKITDENTKFGAQKSEIIQMLLQYSQGKFPFIEIKGLMGMASFTDDIQLIFNEFNILKVFYDSLQDEYKFTTLSMGMSDDYPIAIEQGSTMIRVGSKIFGKRN